MVFAAGTMDNIVIRKSNLRTARVGVAVILMPLSKFGQYISMGKSVQRKRKLSIDAYKIRRVNSTEVLSEDRFKETRVNGSYTTLERQTE
jgi:hypothetical protein